MATLPAFDRASVKKRTALPMAASSLCCKRHAFRLASIFLLFVIASYGPAIAQTTPTSNIAAGVARLVKVYPQLTGVEGNTLVWTDGTRMPIDEGRVAKDHEAMLATADIKDMFVTPYPLGPLSEPPRRDVDPGRARNAAFFDKMYGNCRRGGVAGNLVDIVWLPKRWGRTVKATRINGVADQLRKVSTELDALPSRFDRFLFPPAGTYNCRPIAGTTRVSAHGHGIAVDIATKMAHYWRWSGKAGAAIPYRNSIPFEIVDVFERHGFIWGGKWYHYDTMHFEYRPELMADGR
jgi:hypothetical protein